MARYAVVEFDTAREFAHIRYRPVTLSTPEDVAAFADEIDREMTRLGRKVDIIIDLGELVVKSGAVASYDEARQRMFEAYARRAYRYSGSTLVRTKILTSSTIRSQAANVFATFDQALNSLLADRAPPK